MTTIDRAHCVSSLCSATAGTVFDYLADPHLLGEWSLGCWDGHVEGSGLIRGVSLFDGAATYARVIPAREHGLIDFEVGDDPARLVRRISARAVPGGDVGEEPTMSLVLLTAWRQRSMDDDRWRRLTVAHAAEILLLRHRIERRSS